MSSQDKIALITGASRGIGKACAQTLAAQGITVIGTATSDAGAKSITDYLHESNNPGCGMKLNITNQEQIQQVLDAIKSDYGTPLILINNAGIARDNLMLRMKNDEWDEIIQTDLSAVFHMTKACLRGMVKARWGRIISMTSVVGCTGNPGQANYAAAKAGVIGFSKSLAQEIASRNITVNTIAPGFINTEMTDVLAEEQKQALLAMIPMQRMGAPEDIAAAVSFLCSDSAGYITGETLHINGGMYMA